MLSSLRQVCCLRVETSADIAIISIVIHEILRVVQEILDICVNTEGAKPGPTYIVDSVSNSPDVL